jgi:glycolate oxidase
MDDKMSKILDRNFGEKASDDELTMAAYGTDASQIEGVAKAVIWPKDIEDVYKVIRYAHRTDSKVTPRGAGTGLVGGAVPQDTIVVDFSRMDRIISIDSRAKTVVVEPGVVLDTLNAELAKHNLNLPVQPGSHAACTIGGMISTNAAGMRALKFGSMIDWVEELEIIDGMGRNITIKKPSVADVCGREGTTGLIVKAKLKLVKPSKMRSLDYFKIETFNELLEVYDSLEKDKLISVEYVDKVASRTAGNGMHYHLFVEYDDDTGKIFDEKAIEDTWAIRKQVGVKLSEAGYTLKEDPKVPQERLAEFMDWLERHDIPSFGHIGLGIIHPRFKDSSLMEEMYGMVRDMGGQVSGEHGIGIKKKEFISDELKAEMKRLKKKYDPQGRLNPGKMV